MSRSAIGALFVACLVSCTTIAGLDGDYEVGELAGSGGSTTTSGNAGGNGSVGSATVATVGTGGSGGTVVTGGGTPGTWSTPQLVNELNSADGEDDPTLTADMLEIYFDSSRPGGLGSSDVWMSTRPSVASNWGAPTTVVELSSAVGDTTPEVSADGLIMFVSSDRGGSDYEIYVSTRPNRSSVWGSPVLVLALNSSGDTESGMGLAPDTLSMVFGSTRPGNGDLDLYFSTRPTPNGTWTAPVLIAELDTGDAENNAWIDATLTELWFDSDRPGGLGGRDFWIATRPSDTDPWNVPVNVTELNSPNSDSDAWLSPDKKTIYFYSDSGGNGEIYMATRP